ncbi:hypothetical protein J1C56_09010 [Aminobacter anthyllidis]|uniref:Tail fiber protein n=1 Tax=Aminobacter anthyllidis TaxID=1035067 RepID=A0A9X1D3G7_9HYPH|nr:hypothetical protein [Aminobacter anthyllidis]MBT1155730.1 hypothetical protein [Aminobacter anthyllidis]
MPRNGSGVMSWPPNTNGVPNTTVSSTRYNAFLADLLADLNAARPVTAGGTGGSTAVSGNDNLNTTGADMASAATLNLANATGVVVNVTGTTPITALGTVSSGALRTLIFAGALTLTHNATSLILPGAANITTAANDTATFRSKGAGNWICVDYKKANGQSVVYPAAASTTVAGLVELATDAEAQAKADATRGLTPSNLAALGASETFAGLVELATAAEVAAGTDTARAPSVSTMKSHQGVAKAWANFNAAGTLAVRDSYNITSITDNGTGDFTLNFTAALGNATYSVVGSGRQDAGGGAYNLGLLAPITLTTTTANIRTRAVNNTALDCDVFCVAVFGD